jgi:hypothetical protein
LLGGAPTCAVFVVCAALALGCGNSEPQFDGPSFQYVLGIAGEGTHTDAGCITLDDGSLNSSSTSFTDAGELANDQCVLAMAKVDGKAFFIAGPGVDIDLKTPDFDGDSVDHSTATTEDPVRNGTFAMQVFQRDGFDDVAQRLWSGKLFVGGLDETLGIARLGSAD